MADLIYQGPAGRRKRVVACAAPLDATLTSFDDAGDGFDVPLDSGIAAVAVDVPSKVDAFRVGNSSVEEKTRNNEETRGTVRKRRGTVRKHKELRANAENARKSGKR